MFQIWYKLVEKDLKIQNLSKIVDFCDVLFDRQIALYDEYKTQFKNIYRSRVIDYFKRSAKNSRNLHETNRDLTPQRVIDYQGMVSTPGSMRRTARHQAALQNSRILDAGQSPYQDYF